MKAKTIKLLDTVALREDIAARKLRAGEVGTVVETLGPGVFEVEFCDDEGQTYAQFALRADQIRVDFSHEGVARRPRVCTRRREGVDRRGARLRGDRVEGRDLAVDRVAENLKRQI